MKDHEIIAASLQDQEELESLRAEVKKLRAEAALVRGAIEELAIGAVPAHWANHFAVANPMDGSRHAVPWEWVEPPFNLVKSKMDSMGDYGTRASQAYHDIYLLRSEREDALQALGMRPDSDSINLADEIQRIRDESRAHFHCLTRVQERLEEALKSS